MSRGSGKATGELARVGRPRTSQFQPYGDRPPRDALLKVATELFTRQGYGVTTTRSIAERAGMRQATMYYYFSGKEEILAELLESTVTASLTRARRLLSEAARPASERLWELCHMEVLALCVDPCPGALYLLPEAGSERFARFHDMREQLRDAYLELLESIASDSGLGVDGAALSLRNDLVFTLVEGAVLARRCDSARSTGDLAQATADAALRIVGLKTGG
ncbi:TetR/AcrR family transcriptional regulator [Streptomyces sp. A1136]|uniref:TetR/AcrR family transcriptional regulator n=1 Tax=Streptomyces sp. A1136 TaxID=2563102 RepID=UPI00109E65D6|nr:TetR/AcrR family transcriptional regulator [Streptomyces sp. A1136]THA53141.1 TetR/AcrR family transcriptional regulator [Streptomyces sp. A1136]